MSYGSEIMEMLGNVKKLRALISEIEEPLEEFNELLFREIVQSVQISKRDEMEVTLLGGLKFTEQI